MTRGLSILFAVAGQNRQLLAYIQAFNGGPESNIDKKAQLFEGVLGFFFGNGASIRHIGRKLSDKVILCQLDRRLCW